jgi:hypothetical protein
MGFRLDGVLLQGRNFVVIDELSPSSPKMQYPQAKINSALQSRLQRVQIQALTGLSWEFIDTESGKIYAFLNVALNNLDLPLSFSN